MPQACAAFGCSNRRTADNRHRGITYHKFPKDPSLRRAWLMAVRRKGFQPSDKTVICSRHFTESDFDRTGQTVRLRERVIPSVFGSCPDQLKKVPSKARSTKTSKHAGEPSRRLALVSECPEPMKAPASDHHYALDPDQVKCKIAEAQARVEDLQRQLRNALDRERRQKQTIKMLLDDLKEKNVIIPEHAAGSHVSVLTLSMQRTTVFSAAQTVSRSVGECIVYADRGRVPSTVPGSQPATVQFAKVIDRLFDIVNT